jgi:hypothetical protein
VVWDTTEPSGEGCEQVFAGGKNEVLIFIQFFIATYSCGA